MPDGNGVIAGVARIAVLRANALGDFLLTLPALTAVRAAYPDAHVTVLGTPMHAELLTGRPGPWDRVAVVPPYPGVRDVAGASPDAPEVAAFLARQRAAGYDLALQLQGGGANSNPLVRALGARVTVGLRAADAPPLDRWIRYVQPQHEVLRMLETVRLAGAVPRGLEPRLEVTPTDRAAAADALGAAGADTTAPLVAIHPGATDARRRWPAESFAAVAGRLAAQGATVVVVGHGPDDAAAATAMASAMPQAPVDLVGRLSLGALAGVLERCRLVVADDSGPRHLAAAVGTATVGVYWCGNVINYGPVACARHRVCVSYRTTCPVCGAPQARSRCGHDPSFVSDVPVDEVLAAALDLWSTAPG